MSGPITAQPISFLPCSAVSASCLSSSRNSKPSPVAPAVSQIQLCKAQFSAEMWRKISSYFLRKYADYSYTKWERTLLWDKIDPYRRPKSFTPIVSIYIAAFYTGVIGAAITEQLYKVLLCFICPFCIAFPFNPNPNN